MKRRIVMYKNKKIYLAIPYSGLPNKSFKVSNKVAGDLIDKGHYVFSPITHSHPIWLAHNKKHNHKVWMRQDRAFVKWADWLYVVVIGKDGMKLIQKSKGVQKEIQWAQESGKKIKYIYYD